MDEPPWRRKEVVRYPAFSGVTNFGLVFTRWRAIATDGTSVRVFTRMTGNTVGNLITSTDTIQIVISQSKYVPVFIGRHRLWASNKDIPLLQSYVT